MTEIFKNPLSAYERALQAILLRVRPAALASLLKRLLLVRRTVIETPEGRFSIDPISNLGRALSQSGVYEPRLTATLGEYLFDGASFVDLGANEGYFTIVAAKLAGRHGRVIAIEPQQRLLPVIAENLRLNDIQTATVLNVAVTDIAQTVSIHLAFDTNTGASGTHRMAKYPLARQDIGGKTLTQVLDDVGLAVVDLLKVDIEGGEYEALLGSPDVFRTGRVRAIALELHPTILSARGLDAAKIQTMLTGFGYRLDPKVEDHVWVRDPV